MRFQIRHWLPAITVIIIAVLVALRPARLHSPRPTRAAVPVKPNTTMIVVAAVPLHRGMPLREEHVEYRQWPKDYLPAGAFTKIEDVVERTVDSLIIEGEPILEGKVVTGTDGRVGALAKPGWRAYSLDMTSVSGNLAGMILPGNRVDILLTTFSRDSIDGSGGETTTTLLQNVEILAVDQFLDPESNDKKGRQIRGLTLHVDSDMAGNLDQAQTKGRITLTPRDWINKLKYLEHW